MYRVRITIRRNNEDLSDDLRWAARMRMDLWSHSSVEIAPDSPAHETHRDGDRNAYFEFTTNRLPEVQRVLREYGYDGRARLDIIEEAQGAECVNCGTLSQEPVTVCPACAFRDIDPCPYCNQEIARLSYIPIAGDLFRCPMCHRRVRFDFNEQLMNANGQYHQPLVRVSPAEAPAEHEV